MGEAKGGLALSGSLDSGSCTAMPYLCVGTTVRRWVRTLLIYSPAIALTVAGAAVLLLVPLYLGPSGGCGGGFPPGTYSCPTAYPGTYDLTGPFLLLGAGIYALAAFAFSLLFRGRARPGAQAPART